MKNQFEENPIIRDSHLPLYSQIRQKLEKEIFQGKYPPGAVLPPENELAEKFSVSRMTLRRAMDQLVSDGVLIRSQGRGTFVNKHPQKPKNIGLTRWTFNKIRKELSIVSNVISVEELSPSLRVANALNMMPGEKVVQITRVLWLNDQTIGFAIDRVPKMIVSNVINWDLENDLLVAFLKKESNLEFGKVIERIRAIVAEEDAAEILGIEENSPLLFIDSLFFLISGIPVILTDTNYRGEFIYRGHLQPIFDEVSQDRVG